MKLRFIDDILNLLYPAECHLCGNPLGPSERFICTPCTDSLPRTGYHRNPRNPVEEKFAGQFPFVSATGHFFYSRDSSLAQLIQDMKYRNFPSIGNTLGEIAGRELHISGFLTDIDVIVPLPMHFLKQARRGYNQTDRIAKGMSKATGIPVASVLKMVRRRKTQTALTGMERLQNAKDLFEARRGLDLSGKGVLLIDDICTTGTTMASAARALLEGYPDCRLSLFALAAAF